MHIDARQLEDESLILGDICIVGAGVAGISIALEWINTPYKVILLEGGGFEYEDRIQELYNGKNTGHNYFPLKSSELHYFGGTSGHWGGMCSLFDPIAFEKRDWVNLSGWPFTDKDLMPYYKRAQVNLDIGPFEFGLDYWQKQDPNFVPMPLDKSVVWHKIWQFSPPTRFGTKYKDTIVNSKNIHLYTYANVVDITANENISSIKEVKVKNYTGKTHRVAAKYFIIACAGIQNPRVLLAANKQAPKGIGNDHDNVGKYFMEHLEFRSAELWLREDNPMYLYMQKPPRVRGEVAITKERQAEYKILNGIVSLVPLALERKMPPFNAVWNTDDPIKNRKQAEQAYDKAIKKSRFQRIFETERSQSFQMILRLEQAPNPNSRVSLDTEKDELGVPRAKLHWDFTSLEKISARKIYEIIGQEVGKAGVGRVKLIDNLLVEGNEVPDSVGGGWHHMGTTRISEDPKKGVTDANCRIHGIDNIYMAGSSCFPTGAGVNPTFTIVALSIRLADHLKQRIGSLV